jgi:hypothetical protein
MLTSTLISFLDKDCLYISACKQEQYLILKKKIQTNHLNPIFNLGLLLQTKWEARFFSLLFLEKIKVNNDKKKHS